VESQEFGPEAKTLVLCTPFLLSLYRVCVLGHAAECSVYYGKQDHWESQEELSEVKDGIVL
jgi:hypothetical protein